MRNATHIAVAFVGCVLATGLILFLAHGLNHMLTNPLVLVIFLIGSGIGICLVALIATGVLRRATGRTFAQLWWRAVGVVGVITLGILFILEMGVP